MFPRDRGGTLIIPASANPTGHRSCRQADTVIVAAHIRFVRFTGPALTEGVERHRVESIEVPITDPARTIVDCFRYRAKVGLGVAMEGLREGLRRRRCTPDDLWRYARTARVWSVMRPYVEAMVADAT